MKPFSLIRVLKIIFVGFFIFILLFKLISINNTQLTQSTTKEIKNKEFRRNTSSNSKVATKQKELPIPLGKPRETLVKSFTRFSRPILEELKKLIEDKVTYYDERLVNLARQVIDLPSESKTIKFSRDLHKTPQASRIDKFLKQKRNGFFIEVGALDGERSSNTLFFEKERGWTGLLIEMDPYFYLQLIGKNRFSYSINACVSPKNHPIMIPYKPSGVGMGKILLNAPLASDVAPCLPLATLLLAINVSHVDFFSLDVEGVELKILETIIPNDQFRIDTLAVEYAHSDKNQLKRFMSKFDYKVIEDIEFYDPKLTFSAVDFIFAKKDL